VNRILALLIHLMTPSPQFDDQRMLIQFLVQTRLEFVQYGHCRPDDGFGEHKGGVINSDNTNEDQVREAVKKSFLNHFRAQRRSNPTSRVRSKYLR
jgi:hypothetical protein